MLSINYLLAFSMCCILVLFPVLSYNLQMNVVSSSSSKHDVSLTMTSTQNKTNQTKRKWEFGRFFKTANYYNALLPNAIRRTFFPQNKNINMIAPKAELWSSKDTKGIHWGPLDDVVMGGVSKSDLSPGEEFKGTWTGYVTSANNGGFAGIRTRLLPQPLDMTSCRGFALRVKGDGNRYKFIIRDDDSWNGVAWSFSYDTIPNKEIEVKVPLSSFTPTKFAKSIEGMRLNAINICAFQMTHSKFEYDGKLNPKYKDGPFRLEIISIGTF
jgi:hypothetical protein